MPCITLCLYVFPNHELLELNTLTKSALSQRFTSIVDSCRFLWLSMICGIFSALFTVSYSQSEDMGIFLSEAALVSKGERLYSQVFEIKDPLFLWGNACAFAILGKVGPYLLDAIIVSFALPIAYLVSKRFLNSELLAFSAALLFQFTLVGQYFNTLRSGTIALVLIMLTFLFALKRKWLTVGILIACVLGFKMPYIVFGIAPAFLILDDRKKRNFGQLILGFTNAFMGMVLILWARNELTGYIQMIQENFRYRTLYKSVVGLPEGVSGQLKIFVGYGSSLYWVIALVLCSLFLLFIFRAKFSPGTIAGLSMLLLGLGYFLGSSVLWPHHLTPTAFLVWSLFIIVCRVNFSIETVRLGAIAILSIALLFPAFSLSGTSFPLQTKQKLSATINPKWMTPIEAEYVNTTHTYLHAPFTYSRLGNVDDMGLAAFLPRKWTMECALMGQFGHESIKTIDDFSSCLETDVQYVFVSPSFFELTRPFGTYEIMKNKISEVLTNSFRCLAISKHPEFQFCTKIKYSPST